MPKTKLMVAGALAAGLVAAGALAWQWSEATTEAYNRDNLIRIHIVPHSDTEVDQRLKDQVRETVVQSLGPLLAGVGEVGDADRVVGANLDLIRQVCEDEINRAGRDYPVQVVYGTYRFPTRTYDGLTLAAGEYRAVRVILGSGAGANWWCVLFPPLCFVHAERDAGTGGADRAAAVLQSDGGDQVQLKFKVAELWERSSAMAVHLAGQLPGRDREKRS